MYALLMSVLVFAGAAAAHVILHRLCRCPVVGLTPYPAGLVFLVTVVAGSGYPMTAVFLYCLLVLGYLLYFLSHISDGQSPSAKMLEIVRSHGPLSEAGVVSRFTNEELIGMRIRRLIGSGWITKKGSTLAPTRRGALIAWLVARYRGLLGWGEGG